MKRIVRMKSHFTLRAVLLALAFMLAFSGGVLAQEETAATVTGQVTDSTGAVVKAALVVITNDTTRQERRVETNDDGQFVFTPLMPGTYTLSVEQTNFKKYVEAGIPLNARDRRAINGVREDGNVSELGTVTSEPNVGQDSTAGPAQS